MKRHTFKPGDSVTLVNKITVNHGKGRVQIPAGTVATVEEFDAVTTGNVIIRVPNLDEVVEVRPREVAPMP